MKKISSSFCMCFDPVVSENGLIVGEGSKSSSSAEVKPLLSPEANTMGSGDKDKDVVSSFGRKNKPGRRSLSRYVKAVFFETTLMKKMRSKKLGQKLHRIYSGDKFKSESKPKKIFNSMINNTPCEDIGHSTRSISSKFSSCLSINFTTNSSSSSPSLLTASGRSSSSSLSYTSRPSLSKTVGNNDMQGKLGKGNGKGRHGFNIGVCSLLLISLLFLVIGGKVCAIFCTSTVLVFANRWIKSIKQGTSENIAVDHRLPEIDSELYKKKIIMDGLLERNHSRNLY